MREPASSLRPAERFDPAPLDAVIARYAPAELSPLAVLQDAQRAYGWLSSDLLRAVAARLGLPLAKVLSVATFYRALALAPQGRTQIRVCMGTACHIRGGQKLVDELGHELGIGPGETTPDRAFSLKTVNCVGACALAPVLLVGEECHAHVTPTSVAALVRGEGRRR